MRQRHMSHDTIMCHMIPSAMKMIPVVGVALHADSESWRVPSIMPALCVGERGWRRSEGLREGEQTK